MDDNNERRSSIDGESVSGLGVGARHRGSAYRQRGGGYLDICTIFESSEKKFRDPRLSEFSEIGLGAHFRELAEEIGYEAFLVVWSKLHEAAMNGPDGHRLYIPKFDSYMRYQRNRYVKALASSGSSAAEVKQLLSSDLGEDMDEIGIRRIIRS